MAVLINLLIIAKYTLFFSPLFKSG